MTQKSILYRQVNMLCAERGISLAQLAKELGTTPQNLYIRLDREKMTYAEMSKIAEKLGCTFSYNFQPLNQQNKFVRVPSLTIYIIRKDGTF